MSASNSAGVEIFISNVDLGVLPNLITTGWLGSSPVTGVSVTDATGVLVGDFIEINNIFYEISAINSLNLTLKGINFTDTVPPNTVTHIPVPSLVDLCLTTVEFSNPELQTQATPSFCNPNASIISAVQESGTVNLGGFVDVTDHAYKELQRIVKEQLKCFFLVKLPNNLGIIATSVTLGGFSYSLPLDGAISWEITGALGSGIKHSYTIPTQILNNPAPAKLTKSKPRSSQP